MLVPTGFSPFLGFCAAPSSPSSGDFGFPEEYRIPRRTSFDKHMLKSFPSVAMGFSLRQKCRHHADMVDGWKAFWPL